MAFNMSFLQRVLPIAILLIIYIITAPAGADHSFDINPNPSPEAHTSLICPNDNPSDCYPALFQPTIHFQKIRPNQSLPPGLHVRLNIQTGEKEARLNVPEETEREESEAVIVIDNLPLPLKDDSIWDNDKPVVSDHLAHSKEVALKFADEDTQPLHLRLQDASKQAEHARPYVPLRPGAVKRPLDTNEASVYDAAVSSINEKIMAKGENGTVYDVHIADAFEMLTDLSHSVEWGVTICRDADLVLPLLESIFYADAFYELELRCAALLLLGTAIQNNPDALGELGNTYDAKGGAEGLIVRTKGSIEADSFLLSEGETYVNIVTREIFFLSQLCAHERMMRCYPRVLDDKSVDGKPVEAFPLFLGLFEASFVKEAKGKAKLKHRIANMIEDHVQSFAAFHMADHGKENEEAAQQTLRVSLQPWCKSLFDDTLDYVNDGSIGVVQAQREVSRVLELYTGEGCVISADGFWR